MFFKAGSKGSESESIYFIFKKNYFIIWKNVSIFKLISYFESSILFKEREKFPLSNVYDNDEN